MPASYKRQIDQMISEIGVSELGQALLLTFSGGKRNRITAVDLRRSAMDAVTKRERIESGTVKIVEGIRITEVFSMGSTGVNIQFSDGHDRAIYPYPYLIKLAQASDN